MNKTWHEVFFPESWTFRKVCDYMAKSHRRFFDLRSELLPNLEQRQKGASPYAYSWIRCGLCADD